MNEVLPHRFRESSFRAYEPYIAQVVKAFPSPITIRPSTIGLSPVTFSCRFRDAIRSLAKHNWQTVDINMDKFKLCHEQIGVSESGDAGMLTIGDRKNLKKTSEGLQTPKAICDSPYGLILDPPTSGNDIALHTVCILAHERLLTQAIQIKNVTLEQKTIYEQQYDVSIELNEATGVASIL